MYRDSGELTQLYFHFLLKVLESDFVAIESIYLSTPGHPSFLRPFFLRNSGRSVTTEARARNLLNDSSSGPQKQLSSQEFRVKANSQRCPNQKAMPKLQR